MGHVELVGESSSGKGGEKGNVNGSQGGHKFKVFTSTTDDAELFDAVVIATDALAVRHIVGPELRRRLGSENLEVFGRFPVSQSSAVVHTDETLMPPDRSKWGVFNVGHASKENTGKKTGGSNLIETPSTSSQLTVWYNAFFGKADYFGQSDKPYNVFVTWNPIVQPKPECVLNNTPSILLGFFTRVIQQWSFMEN